MVRAFSHQPAPILKVIGGTLAPGAAADVPVIDSEPMFDV